MSTAYKISNGWFSEVYGHPVAKRDYDEPGYDAFNYARGYPIGVLEHYTAGCGEDMSGNIQNRGYVICNFSVGRGGAMYQYVPLNRGTWHAHDAGENLVGIEFTCYPGDCNLTDEQYAAGVALNAAIVVAVRELYGFEIPLEHVGGCPIATPGFKEHGDGATPSRCSWDPNVHTDNPITVWGGGRPGAEVGKGWAQFFDDVRARMEGEGEADMTNEQAATLEKIYDFERGLIRGILGSGLADDKPSDQYANGYTAGQRIIGVWQWQDGFTTGAKGEPKPADPEAAKGWTAAKNLRG